ARSATLLPGGAYHSRQCGRRTNRESACPATREWLSYFLSPRSGRTDPPRTCDATGAALRPKAFRAGLDCEKGPFRLRAKRVFARIWPGCPRRGRYRSLDFEHSALYPIPGIVRYTRNGSRPDSGLHTRWLPAGAET